MDRIKKISAWFVGESNGHVIILPERDWSVSVVVCGVVIAVFVWAGIAMRMYVVTTIDGSRLNTQPVQVETLDSKKFDSLFAEFDARAERYNTLRALPLGVSDPLNR